MSKVSLYRTHRPQSFDQVVGQKFIVQILKNSAKLNQVAHAYLFSGPRGTGKTSLAKILAKAINCENPTDGNPCNSCDTCRQITSGSEMDVIEMDAASNRGIDDIRIITESVATPPSAVKRKVFIIDEVHMLTTAAFNALLKTLEEPQSNVVFILATTELHKVPDTILSRCQRFEFKEIQMRDIKGLVKNVASKTGVTISDKSAELIARFARGAARDALSILEQVISMGDNVTEELVVQVMGTLASDDIINFIIDLNNTTKTISNISSLKSKTINIDRLTNSIVNIIRDSLVYLKTQNQELMEFINPDQAIKLCNNLDMKSQFELVDSIIESKIKMMHTSNPWELFEITLLKLTKDVVKPMKHIEQPLVKQEEIIEEVVELKQENVEVDIEKIYVEDPVVEMSEKVDEIEKTMTLSLDTDSKVGLVEVDNTDQQELLKDPKEDVIIKEDIVKTQIINLDESSSIGLGSINNTSLDDTVVINSDETIKPKAETSIQEVKLQEASSSEVGLKTIINYLIQFDKELTSDVKNKWQIISNYTDHRNTSKIAELLLSGKPGLACKNGLVVVFEHQPQADLLNSNRFQDSVLEFTKELFGEKMILIGLTSYKWEQARDEFIKLRQAWKLPKAETIKVPVKEEKVNSYESDIKNTFGSLVEE